ncbi:MAG: hypothetical protein WHV67_02780 [Thermoanaerobaculia bacterium]
MKNLGKINFGCIVMLLILIVVGYALYIIIPIKIKAAELKKTAEMYALQGSLYTREQIMTELVEKAKQLDLPVTEKNIKIEKSSSFIKIDIYYTVPIDIMGYKTELKFNPHFENPLF